MATDRKILKQESHDGPLSLSGDKISFSCFSNQLPWQPEFRWISILLALLKRTNQGTLLQIYNEIQPLDSDKMIFKDVTIGILGKKCHAHWFLMNHN